MRTPQERRSRQPRELLDRVVGGHGRAGRTDEQLVAQVPAVEELQQLLVVGAVVGEHERLERGVALLPGRRSPAEERLQIVEIGLGARVADLVEALQMAREAERDAQLVALVLVGEVEAAQRPHEVLVRLRRPVSDAVRAPRPGRAPRCRGSRRAPRSRRGSSRWPTACWSCSRSRRGGAASAAWNASWFDSVNAKWWCMIAARSTGAPECFAYWSYSTCMSPKPSTVSRMRKAARSIIGSPTWPSSRSRTAVMRPSWWWNCPESHTTGASRPCVSTGLRPSQPRQNSRNGSGRTLVRR